MIWKVINRMGNRQTSRQRQAKRLCVENRTDREKCKIRMVRKKIVVNG